MGVIFSLELAPEHIVNRHMLFGAIFVQAIFTTTVFLHVEK